MRKIPNTKMKLLTDLQYRYDQLKAFNVGKIECSDGKILDFDLTKVLKMYEELMLLLVEDIKLKVLEIDLSNIPKDTDLNELIDEFKANAKEWSQPHLNSFLNSKFGINNTEL
jgi:hypothetical protein